MGDDTSGAFLERYRTRVSGLSIRAAASRVGVTAGTWKDWETGRRPIPLGKVSAVEDALGIADGSMKTGKVWEWRVQEHLEKTIGTVNSRAAVSKMVEVSLSDYLDLWEGASRSFAPHPAPEPLPDGAAVIVTADVPTDLEE